MTWQAAPVLVTGATGNVGREVVRCLGEQGTPFVAAVTDLDRARTALGASTLADAHLADLCEDSTLSVPAGHGRVAFVDVRDVAEVASRSFMAPARQGQAWTLMAAEAFTFDEVAALLSPTLGRTVRYKPASIPEKPSAESIIPEFQTLRIGDWVPMFRKLLLNLRRRAEAMASTRAAGDLAPDGKTDSGSAP